MRIECCLTVIRVQGVIRLIAQQLMWETDRIAFKTLNLDVYDCLSRERVLLRFTNVYGNPAQEKVLAATIKRVCSSVRNGFREAVRGLCFPNPWFN